MMKMKPIAQLAACGLLLLAAIPLAAQSVNHIDPALRSRIDRIATQVLAQTGVPSASIAVVQHGKLVYTHAYGSARWPPIVAAVPPRPRCATPSDRSPSNSPPRPFCMLQEQGKLSLDDPVGKYIPGLTRGNEVTIRQILSHTSGYQDYWPEDYVMTPMLQPTTAQQILDTWAKKPLDFEPGTQWQYSNTNYVIAGRIVEIVTGQPLLGLPHTAHLPSAGNDLGLELRRNQAHAGRRHGLLSPRTRSAAPRAQGGPRLDVRCRRAGHDRARPGPLG